MTCARYLQRFQTRRRELWDVEPAVDDYPRTVAVTFDLAVQQLSADAVSLLRLLAFLAPEAIPPELLDAASSDLHSDLPPDDLQRDAALQALQKYALLETAGDSVRVHRLLQAVVRDGLDAAAERGWIEASLRLIRQTLVIDHTDPRTATAALPLMPHALAVAGQGEQSACGLDDTSWVFNRLAVGAWCRRALSSARSLMQRAITIDEKTHEPDHPTLAERYSNLALIEQDLGDLPAARDLMQRAIDIEEKAYESDHPTLAVSYSNLGLIEKDLGDLPAARDLMQRAIDINEKVLDDDHPERARDYSNLATIEQDLGDLPAARVLMQRAIAILEQAYEPDHLTLANSYSNLAMIERDLGDLPAARDLMQRAIAISEQAYEPDHPTLALSYWNLGRIEEDDGNIEQARTLIERAHAIFLQRLGPEHPHTQMCAEWLSEHGDPS